ncbi:MAG TPA: hypothetical protein VD761_05680 [Solirubrobacterales bacterium]|nr:hypothetical protein [Solirubrobacterales bacterium]
MWTVDDEMQTFKALSYRDKVRVSSRLARGRAPADPLLATAAVELAESYQRQERLLVVAMRWLPVLVFPVFALAAVFTAIDGEWRAILYGLVAVGNLAQLAINPVTRPKNMARALEASRRVTASQS